MHVQGIMSTKQPLNHSPMSAAQVFSLEDLSAPMAQKVYCLTIQHKVSAHEKKKCIS